MCEDRGDTGLQVTNYCPLCEETARRCEEREVDLVVALRVVRAEAQRLLDSYPLNAGAFVPSHLVETVRTLKFIGGYVTQELRDARESRETVGADG